MKCNPRASRNPAEIRQKALRVLKISLVSIEDVLRELPSGLHFAVTVAIIQASCPV